MPVQMQLRRIIISEIQDEQVTVADQMEYLLKRIETERTFIFSDLFPGKITLRVLVATEIGMLRKETQFAEFQTLKAKYEREILASRDAVFGMSAELGELKARIRTDVQAARQSMMKTLTWRVGSMVLKPLNLMKKLLRKS